MKEYIKLYQKKREENYQKWGDFYPPQDWQEFEELNRRIFEEHLEKNEEVSDPVLKMKLYLGLLLKEIRYFGYYIAFSEGDFQKLNRALWQTGRTLLLTEGIVGGGRLYTGDALNALFTCFACNDFEGIPSFIPATLPTLKGSFYTGHVIRLLWAIYYKEDEKLQDTMLQTESFLSKKKLTGIEEYYVRFFLSLAKKDAEGLSECLQKLCEAYQKQGYPVKKIDKCFAPEVHGLYHLIRFLEQALFERIRLPSHKCFLKEFEEWQQKNNFPKSGQFYEYPEKLHDLNLILQRPLPKIHVSEIRGHSVIDVEKFAAELNGSI